MSTDDTPQTLKAAKATDDRTPRSRGKLGSSADDEVPPAIRRRLEAMAVAEALGVSIAELARKLSFGTPGESWESRAKLLQATKQNHANLYQSLLDDYRKPETKNDLRFSVTPEIHDRLEMMAVAEAFGITISALARKVPMGIAPLHTACIMRQTKYDHARLYRRLLRRYRKVARIRESQERRDSQDGYTKGSESIPNRVAKWMETVVSELVRSGTTIQRIATARRIPSFRFYTTKYPGTWKDICDKAGLGWHGRADKAPRALFARARIRRAARIIAAGLTGKFAADRMGLRPNAISKMKTNYPEFWDFHYDQACKEMDLAENEHLVARVDDDQGKVVQKSPPGTDWPARKKMRQERGLPPLRGKRKGGFTGKGKTSATQPVATSPSGRVCLHADGEKPTIDGEQVGVLTTPQYNVIMALMQAGERGLSKDQLQQSGHSSARDIMRRLRCKDKAWQSVLSFPGIAGKGYRIL